MKSYYLSHSYFLTLLQISFEILVKVHILDLFVNVLSTVGRLSEKRNYFWKKSKENSGKLFILSHSNLHFFLVKKNTLRFLENNNMYSEIIYLKYDYYCKEL